jgi:RND family efflux transporter MFP subunit
MKRNWIVGAIVLVLIAMGALLFIQQRGATTAASTARPQTARVERGSLVATVQAAGNVSAVTTASLGFLQSGRVAQVNVQVGDRVKAGQLLMQLDTTDLLLSLRTAQANLTSSQANYDAAKQKNAQINNQLIVAKVQLEKARIALEQAQGNYNKIAWRGDVGLTQQATDLRNATIEYESALANYKMTEATINDSALKTATADLERTKIAVEQAERNLEKAKIVAPFDGIIAQVNFNVGDSAGTGAAVVLVDLSQLQIKVTVAEVDIAKIKVAQTAQITFDALAGKSYSGKVITISPQATVQQGVVNYPVTVAIADPDAQVKPGMTANLAIQVDRRDDVLLIPSRAVRTQGNQRTVTVLYRGQMIPVPVTTGLSSDQLIEISSGLKEGDEVLIQQTQTRTGNIPGVPGAGPIFFGGR